jgi:hypothetical protein
VPNEAYVRFCVSGGFLIHETQVYKAASTFVLGFHGWEVLIYKGVRGRMWVSLHVGAGKLAYESNSLLQSEERVSDGPRCISLSSGLGVRQFQSGGARAAGRNVGQAAAGSKGSQISRPHCPLRGHNHQRCSRPQCARRVQHKVATHYSWTFLVITTVKCRFCCRFDARHTLRLASKFQAPRTASLWPCSSDLRRFTLPLTPSLGLGLGIQTHLQHIEPLRHFNVV